MRLQTHEAILERVLSRKDRCFANFLSPSRNIMSLPEAAYKLMNPHLSKFSRVAPFPRSSVKPVTLMVSGTASSRTNNILAHRTFLFDRDIHDSMPVSRDGHGKTENVTGNTRQSPSWTDMDQNCVSKISISRISRSVQILSTYSQSWA